VIKITISAEGSFDDPSQHADALEAIAEETREMAAEMECEEHGAEGFANISVDEEGILIDACCDAFADRVEARIGEMFDECDGE
jgi:hypothetical protein